MTDTVLSIFSIAAMVAVSILCFFVLSTTRRLRAQCSVALKDNAKTQETVKRLESELRALLAGSAGLTEHVSRVDQQLRRLTERQQALEMNDTANQSYDYAIKLIKNGASAEDLMARCGLVRNEAELLIHMYRLDSVG